MTTPVGETIVVTVSIQRVGGVTMWPKIDILGVETSDQYEALTESYEALATSLHRLVAQRRKHWPLGRRAQDRPLKRAVDRLGDDAWVQLTLSTDATADAEHWQDCSGSPA